MRGSPGDRLDKQNLGFRSQLPHGSSSNIVYNGQHALPHLPLDLTAEAPHRAAAAGAVQHRRLRWTSDLHAQFVEVVRQLGECARVQAPSCACMLIAGMN